MKRDELDRLLARYHMGELSAMERKRLFDAAMEQQSVFDELMLEDGLRDALADPVLREMALEDLNEVPELRAASVAPMAASERATEPAREPAPAEGTGWWRRWMWPAVATVATACVAVGVFLWQKPASVDIAAVKPPQVAPSEQRAARTEADSPSAPPPEQSQRPKAIKRFEAPAAPAAPAAVGKAVVSAPEVEVAANLPKAKTDAAAGAAPAPAAVPASRAASAPQGVAMSELKDARQLQGATVALSVLNADGQWRRVDGPVPRGARLRATVTSDRDAVAILEPVQGRPVPVRAGVPADIELPTGEAGERSFTVTFRDSSSGRLDDARAVAMRAAESDEAKREDGARSKERANELMVQKSATAKMVATPLLIRYRVQ